MISPTRAAGADRNPEGARARPVQDAAPWTIARMLEDALALRALPPFDAMAEDEVMRTVDEEIASARAEEAGRLKTE